MGLGAFKVRWAPALQWLAGAALELVGILPRERCCACSTRLAPDHNYCGTCGLRRGGELADFDRRRS